MKTQLIILPEQPILVSDERPKTGDWRIVIDHNSSFFGKYEEKKGRTEDSSGMGTVIAGLPQLPSIDFNGFEKKFGIDIGEKKTKEAIAHWSQFDSEQAKSILYGLNLALDHQQLSEKKYSEEDIKEIYSWGFYDGCSIDKEDDDIDDAHDCYFNNFKKSLQQPKVFDVEVEGDVDGDREIETDVDGHVEIRLFPKVTNNSIKITKVL